MKDFRKLTVWQKAHELTLAVYKATRGFPKEELYGLTSQVRRSSVSVPSNIAEGCGRSGDAELARFLDISMGSASESSTNCCLLTTSASCTIGYMSRLPRPWSR